MFKSECNECLNRYTPTFEKVEEVGVVEGGGRVEGKREMKRGGGCVVAGSAPIKTPGRRK